MGGPSAVYSANGATLTGQGTAARLQVRPVLGRSFAAGENEPGRNRVAVLGEALWRDRFGADPAVVGRTISLDRQPHVVVEVAPRGFRYPEDTEIWTPLAYDARFLTLGGVALLLLATTLLAGYVPARRATRVDPVIALRAE